MYDLNLTESHVSAQADGTVVDLAVGDLLREQAAALPDVVAVEGAGRFSSGDGRHGAGTVKP